MFGLFKKKDPVADLKKKYADLLKEAHQLSSVNRKESDKKTAEAHAVLVEIEKLQAQP